MMAPDDPRITLFYYTFSPYAKRVVWYLNLRGISYEQCLQPPIMPRPDLAALGVQYRRIPVLTIDKDVYCDTRLILQKLEEQFPQGALGVQDADGKALERLLEIWSTDGGVFARAVQLIPPDSPLTSDPKFRKDREDYSGGGGSWAREKILRGRPEAMAHMKQAFELIETTLLADGRAWIRKTTEPTLADIHAAWALDWVIGLKGAAESDHISERHYPKVYAWIARLRERLAARRSAMPKPKTVLGSEVLEHIKSTTREYAEPEGTVDEADPLKLRKGQQVEVWPTDGGSSGRTSGTLVGLNGREVVIQRQTADKQSDVRIHFPRINFRIAVVEDAAGPKL